MTFYLSHGSKNIKLSHFLLFLCICLPGDQCSTGMEGLITSLCIPFLPWFLGTSCGNFRPYIIDLSKSWPDVSAAAVWFIMPFLRTDILEILNLAGPLPDNKVFFFLTFAISSFAVSQISKFIQTSTLKSCSYHHSHIILLDTSPSKGFISLWPRVSSLILPALNIHWNPQFPHFHNLQ